MGNKLYFIYLLIFTIFLLKGCHQREDINNKYLSNDFITSLVNHQIEQISIKIPKELNIEKDIKKSRRFSNTNKTKALLISINPEWKKSIGDLPKDVPNYYKFFEKIYFPGLHPGWFMLKRQWKSDYKKIDKMKKIDFEQIRGFLTKGLRKHPQKGEFYTYDYQIFNKKNDKYLEVIIYSKENYFLNEAESDYIVSNIHWKNNK